MVDRGDGLAPPSTGSLTRILRRVEQGEAGAFDELLHLAYPELMKIARARLYNDARPDALNTTALVHECYLKLARNEASSFPDRKRFYAYASKIMRSIIVDFARSARADKRGGDDGRPVTLDTAARDAVSPAEDVTQIDAALADLERIDSTLGRVVEMRFFGGFTDGEIAEVIDCSERTVRRHWERARLLLATMLAPDAG